MSSSKNYLLSDILSCTVRCDRGLNHGSGYLVWMHPPVHRILGWVTRPSTLKLSLDVWRLNQLKGIDTNNIYVKGSPASSDQTTINRFPTLINASLLNKKGEKLAKIVDLVFELSSGKILYYLVSRSNPKIPGSSRWSLNIDNITDQQPGTVVSNLYSIDDLPLIRSSIKEEFLQKSKDWRSQFKEITNRASSNLEGWLEDSPWEDGLQSFTNNTEMFEVNDDWIDSNDKNQTSENLKYSDKAYNVNNDDSDPWI